MFSLTVKNCGKWKWWQKKLYGVKYVTSWFKWHETLMKERFFSVGIRKGLEKEESHENIKENYICCCAYFTTNFYLIRRHLPVPKSEHNSNSWYLLSLPLTNFPALVSLFLILRCTVFFAVHCNFSIFHFENTSVFEKKEDKRCNQDD